MISRVHCESQKYPHLPKKNYLLKPVFIFFVKKIIKKSINQEFLLKLNSYCDFYKSNLP